MVVLMTDRRTRAPAAPASPARVRLSDIAAQAGVSEATASRVINGKANVRPELRQAVLEAMDTLGYERPTTLRHKVSGSVGLVVPELENPIFPAFAQAIGSRLAQAGYTPLLCTQAPGGVTEDEYVEMLVDRGVAGIVFVSGLHADTSMSLDRYQRLLELGIPLVFLNGYADAVRAPFVSTDDIASMRVVLSHLVELGHRRIGLMVGPERFVPSQRKVEGFKAAVTDLLGITEDEAAALVITTLWTLEGGHSAALRLLEQGATAIVGASDLMALGAIRAVRSRGRRVPEDVSVVGFDDSPLIGFTDPPLTTVRAPVDAMSHTAVQSLLEAIDGREIPSSEYLFGSELIVRGSTAAAPTEPAGS